jgi:hypothetical protein
MFVTILRQSCVSDDIFKSYEYRLKIAILGMFANLLAAVESAPIIAADFVDVVFMAMLSG